MLVLVRRVMNWSRGNEPRNKEQRETMTIFTIDTETNNITAHPTLKQAQAVPGAERFTEAESLAALAASWPASRLVEIWNSLPGVTPVRKFKDRATAVSRIWKAIQSLAEASTAASEFKSARPQGPAVATSTESGPETEAETTPANSKAHHKKKPVLTARGTAAGPSKTEMVVALLRRPNGASLQEIRNATGWQAHSVRGFLSGTLRKKMRLTVISTKFKEGERIYSLKS